MCSICNKIRKNTDTMPFEIFLLPGLICFVVGFAIGGGFLSSGKGSGQDGNVFND